MTREGHYYSWDVRLISLLVAWIFLFFYYKKYHTTRDITTRPVWGTWLHDIPVWFCCKNDTGISAPLNEEATERMISRDVYDSGVSGYRRTIETQTSLTELLHGAFPDPPSAPPIHQGPIHQGSIQHSGQEFLEMKPIPNDHQQLPVQKQPMQHKVHPDDARESPFLWPPVLSSNTNLTPPISETVTPVNNSDSTVKSKISMNGSMERTPLRTSYRQAMGRTGSNSPLHM